MEWEQSSYMDWIEGSVQIFPGYQIRQATEEHQKIHCDNNQNENTNSNKSGIIPHLENSNKTSTKNGIRNFCINTWKSIILNYQNHFLM